MACFGRTAQPRLGQASARLLRSVVTAALWLALALGYESATAQAGDRPAAASSAAQVAQAAPGAGPPSAAATVADGVLPPPSAAAPPKAAPRAVDDIVTVDPGSTCLERTRLIQRVERWLQRAEVEAPLHVHVRGDARVSSRVFFSVSTSPGASAERRLDNVPSDCDQLHSAVALSIALAIEATLQQGELAGAPPALAPPRADEGPSAPMHLELAILGGTSIGVLTDASWAVTPRLSLSLWSWFEVAIAGLGAFLDDQTIMGFSGKYSMVLWAIGIDLCVGGETTQRLGFYMCAGARGGPFQSQGEGIGKDLKRTEAWWGVTGSGQARFWFTSIFALGGSVEAVYALRARQLTVLDKGQEVSRTVVPRLGLSVTAGPVFRFF
jgi:hypothetical protein